MTAGLHGPQEAQREVRHGPLGRFGVLAAGHTTELNLADFFRANKLKYEPVIFATADETIKAYDAGRCDVFTTDASGLYAERLKLTNPDDHMVLPEIISKEPLGRSGAMATTVGRHREVDPLRDADGRRTRCHQGQP